MSGTLGNIKVEPCTVSLGGLDLGFTDGDLELTPEEQGVEISAHQEGTNVLDMIRTGKTLELAVTLKETSVTQVKALLERGGGTSAEVAQIATLTCVADVASSLHGKSFELVAQDGSKFLFQLKENATPLVPPVISGYTVVQIGYDEGDGANTIADAVAAAIDLLPEFTAPNPAAAAITVTWADSGAVPSDSTIGNTGFTLVVDTAGSSGLSGWGGSKDFTSMLADAEKLVLHPVTKDDDDLSADFAAWKAYPMINSIVKSGENPNTVAVTFKIFPDLTKDKAIRLFVIGDHS